MLASGRQRFIHGAAVALAILISLVIKGPGPCVAAAADSAPPRLVAPADSTLPELTAQQQKALNVALADFRGKPRQRATAVKRALAVGPRGAAAMRDKIDTELAPLLAKYRAVCSKLAAAEYATRLKTVPPEQLAEWRKSVLDLRDVEDLTKEQIVEVSDPVMKRLAELLLIDRVKLLSASPEVRKQRPGLLQFAPYWEACAAALADVPETALDKSAADNKTAEKNAAAKYDINVPETATIPQPATFEDYLTQLEMTALLESGPVDEASRRVLAVNAATAAAMDPEEFRCLNELNVARLLLGLNALAFDPKLLAAARDHSADMKKHSFFAHESPVEGKKTFVDRAKNFATTASGENIFMGINSGSEAHEGWFHSPGHFKNQLGDHQRVAIGRHLQHWTQLFGG